MRGEDLFPNRSLKEKIDTWRMMTVQRIVSVVNRHHDEALKLRLIKRGGWARIGVITHTWVMYVSLAWFELRCSGRPTRSFNLI